MKTVSNVWGRGGGGGWGGFFSLIGLYSRIGRGDPRGSGLPIRGYQWFKSAYLQSLNLADAVIAPNSFISDFPKKQTHNR